MKKLIPIILITLLWLSCNKDETKDDAEPTPLTNKELLIGKWDTEYTILDSNKNGLFEQHEETRPDPNSDDQLILHFLSNGNGATTTKFNDIDTGEPKEITDSFKWSMAGDMQFKITQERVGSNGPYTYTATNDIVSLSNTNLTIEGDYVEILNTDTTTYRQRFVMKKIP